MSKIEYDVDQIKSLQNIDVIRQMPAMYLGNLNSTEQLLIEIISNSIDEFMAGHGNVIDVHIFKDCSVEITDRGRGIPVGLSKIFKDDNGNPIDTLTGILTTLHSGGKYSHMGDSGYKTATSGLHGCGACATNAVSDKFIATVKRNGHIYRQEFEKGIPVTDVEIIGDTDETGTTIFYHPDKTIYKISLEPYGKMEQRLSELASLNSGLTINYINDKRKINKTFFFEDGIRGYTLQMIENRQKLYEDPFSIKGDFDNLDGSKINVDISFIHDDETEPSGKVKAFVNSVNTYEFGTHVLGFRQGYREIINEYAINKKLIKEPIEMRYLEDGLYVTISLKMTNAEFEGQTKTKLGNAIAKDAVVDVLKKGFEKIIKNKQLCKTIDLIVDRANKTKVAELAARQARANSRKAKNLNKMALPGKLADCANHDGQSELFIVEGDSAAGSTKAARWKEFQSVLPLRGKILNVSKADIGKILNSEIIKGIFAAVGGGVGKSFDINNIRYDKVIMMCDADVDGSHIKSLLLTLFYYYMPQLITNGHVYAAIPPLYRIIKKDTTSLYLTDDKALEEYRKQHPGEKYTVNRFKGLGEMNAQELKETVMDPRKRTLMRISIDDAEEAARTFEILMGKDASLRKVFIEENAFSADLSSL